MALIVKGGRPRVCTRDPIRRVKEVRAVIILGIVLLILAALFNIGFLWALGVILIVIGVILWILGAMGRAIGGRRHYY